MQPLTGRNGLTSREVVLLDSRTIVIKDFSFRGRAPNTHFLVGVAGTIPNDIDGFVIPNEKGTDEPLSRQEVLNSPCQFCIILTDNNSEGYVLILYRATYFVY